MEQITTFNNYRDESLRDATYFNVSKFPTATYTAEGFSNQTNDWKIEGKLKLMGVELKVPIDLKRIESKEKAVLVGKATFDRTLFGMKPDPKEGNVVDLTFVLNLSENQK